MSRQRKSATTLFVVAALSMQLINVAGSSAAAKNPAHATSSVVDDRTAIKKQLSTLNRSVVAGSASTLASLWADDGTYTDDDGNVFEGKASIEKHFKALFADGGGFPVDVVGKKLRLLDKDVALAEGTVQRTADNQNLDTRFSIVLTKSAGKWLISSAVETPVAAGAPAPEHPLAQLDWLIGDWNAENAGAKVHLKADWTSSKNFILCRYEIQKANQPVENEIQVLGWDPHTQEIISWNFDSSGGFGHGRWSKKDNNWVIESSGTKHGGETTRALNVLTVADANSFVWESINRSIDGVAVADTAPLKVQRATP